MAYMQVPLYFKEGMHCYPKVLFLELKRYKYNDIKYATLNLKHQTHDFAEFWCFNL